MGSLRRRLASWALGLTVLQFALLFTAPVTACCVGKVEAAAAVECCPAGAHPAGECPLHKAARSADCAFRCDSTHAPDFVLGTVGVLTAPIQQLAAPLVRAVDPIAPAIALARTTHPDAPPPKAL